jgi:VWFA-related protein
MRCRASLYGAPWTRYLKIVCLPCLFVLCVSHADAQTNAPDFRVASNVVLVPTLVTDESGSIIFGLKKNDFVVKDNGKKQDIRLDASPDIETISLVVSAQNGGSARLLFDGGEDEFTRKHGLKPEKLGRPGAVLSGLGTMVENFIGKSMSEIAVVAFDSRVQLLQDFTDDMGAVQNALESLQGSTDGGTAILDAVSYSLDLLARHPEERLRILLLISETHDHGSRKNELDTVLMQAASGNALVYCAAFSALRLEAVRDLKETVSAQGPRKPVAVRNPTKPDPVEPGFNLLKPLIRLITSAASKNFPRRLADSTGGEYHQFSDKRSFDAALGAIANSLRNTYRISFQPQNPHPGFHEITVRLRKGPEGASVRAKKSYWVDRNED